MMNSLERRLCLWSNATCAMPLCEALLSRRGQGPHHARKDRVGTWDISRLTVSCSRRRSASGRRGAVATQEVGPRHSSDEAGEQSEESLLRRHLRGRSQRCRWSEGRGARGMRTGKARTGRRARLACQKRWNVYGNLCRHTPEVGAVCGKAARTVLGGGRAMKRASLPLHTSFSVLISANVLTA